MRAELEVELLSLKEGKFTGSITMVEAKHGKLVNFETWSRCMNNVYTSSILDHVYIVNPAKILRFEVFFGPFKFKLIKLKKRPAINRTASYSLGSYPFIPVIAVPE